MRKKFCFKKILTTILIVALFVSIGILAFHNLKKTQENEKLQNELDLIKAEQKALWDCIVKCNKKKVDNAECWCIQASKKIRVY